MLRDGPANMLEKGSVWGLCPNFGGHVTAPPTVNSGAFNEALPKEAGDIAKLGKTAQTYSFM